MSFRKTTIVAARPHRSPFSFIVLMVVAALVAGADTYMLTWAAKVTGCRHAPVAGAFLAYCQNDNFGDYEHGAYYLDLQPTSVASMKQASVLFIGNSTTQFAFSTNATDQYFRKNNISFYLLGFGYGEYINFFGKLKERYDLRPKMIVINADEFFFDGFSSAARAVVRLKASAVVDYAMKWLFVKLAGKTCTIVSCTTSDPVIFRNQANGEWIWQTTFAAPDLAEPITDETKSPFTDREAQAMEPIARHYIDDLGLKKSCIVLTGAPSSGSDNEAIVARLSSLFSLPMVYPKLSGLSTIDGAHLNAESAERWSSEFMKQFAPIMRSCLGPPVHSD